MIFRHTFIEFLNGKEYTAIVIGIQPFSLRKAISAEQGGLTAWLLKFFLESFYLVCHIVVKYLEISNIIILGASATDDLSFLVEMIYQSIKLREGLDIILFEVVPNVGVVVDVGIARVGEVLKPSAEIFQIIHVTFENFSRVRAFSSLSGHWVTLSGFLQIFWLVVHCAFKNQECLTGSTLHPE